MDKTMFKNTLDLYEFYFFENFKFYPINLSKMSSDGKLYDQFCYDVLKSVWSHFKSI